MLQKIPHSLNPYLSKVIYFYFTINVLKTSIVSLFPQNFFYPFQACAIILLIKSFYSENNLIELEQEKEIVDMDTTQQQVGK